MIEVGISQPTYNATEGDVLLVCGQLLNGTIEEGSVSISVDFQDDSATFG